MAHPCGYDVSGLGFYHIPHAPINFGRYDNRTALVTVQGGELSIPQLVVELSRLIPENGIGPSLNMTIIHLLFPFLLMETYKGQ
jgi:hypothetical protein